MVITKAHLLEHFIFCLKVNISIRVNKKKKLYSNNSVKTASSLIWWADDQGVLLFLMALWIVGDQHFQRHAF